MSHYNEIVYTIWPISKKDERIAAGFKGGGVSEDGKWIAGNRNLDPDDRCEECSGELPEWILTGTYEVLISPNVYEERPYVTDGAYFNYEQISAITMKQTSVEFGSDGWYYPREI